MKFSIIIPTRNGGKYLPYCLETITSQNYNDVEIIISNNNSIDNTEDFLSTINDKRIKIIKPDKLLGMAEHYEYALSHVSGEWVLIIGDDDGVQPYFFELVDFLTTKAIENNIKLINCKRSYFFWAGCESLYKNDMVSYDARSIYTIENLKYHALTLFTSFEPYFNIPQMYTTSIFHRSIIEKVKEKQNGLFFTAITPDANAAAIAVSLEKKYLDCRIPFSWVGTSPKSYGVLGEIMTNRIYNKEYSSSVNEMMKLSYHNKYTWENSCGNMKIISCVLYFYEAMLKSYKLQSVKMQKLLRFKYLKLLVLAGVLKEIDNDTKTKEERILFIKEICDLNDIKFNSVKFVFKHIIPYLNKYFSKKYSKVEKNTEQQYFCLNRTNENIDFTILDAYNIIKDIDSKNNYVKNFISKNI